MVGCSGDGKREDDLDLPRPISLSQSVSTASGYRAAQALDAARLVVFQPSLKRKVERGAPGSLRVHCAASGAEDPNFR